MPRGVAIPELRQQLFAAVERLMAQGGPSRLTGRAVTREAQVATGLLHAHFADFDDFLAGYALDRAFHLAGEVADLPGRAGSGTVAGNLTWAVRTPSWDMLSAMLRLMAGRPELTPKVEAVLGPRTAGLDGIEQTIGAYLAAEQRLGRVHAGTDAGALALTVVGVLHHLVLTGGSDRIERAVAAVSSAAATSTARCGCR